MAHDLREHVGRTVTVCGWVNTLRLQSKMQFVVVRDGTGMVQVTYKRDNGPLEAQLQALTPESAVEITGQVVNAAQVRLGGLEIVPEAVDVLNPAATPLPIDEQTGIEHRLDWRFLDVRRRPAAQLMFAVQTTLEQGMREYAYAQGATEMHTPKLAGTASESGAEVFELGYFGRSAYLAQSPQFYKQMAISAGIEKVFEIGPVFRCRAVVHLPARHRIHRRRRRARLDRRRRGRHGVRGTDAHPRHRKVADAHGEAVREQFGVEITVPTTPFPRITMAEAHDILREGGWDPEGVKEDLDPEGERSISAHIQQATGHEFVFVTHYPVGIRPFYHMRTADDPSVTLSFDLLWKGLEITTGAQREHRYDVLLKQAAEKGMSPEPMRDYLNAFRYGCPPHGGLGMGLGRVLMVLLGLESIREATFLFRGPNRLTP